MLAGYEAMVRLGVAINGPMVLYRGIWPSYFLVGLRRGGEGAARLMDLAGAQAAHALALALNLSGPGVGQHGAPGHRALARRPAPPLQRADRRACRQGRLHADTAILDGKYFPGVLDIAPERCGADRRAGRTAALHPGGVQAVVRARRTMAATQAFAEIVARDLLVADDHRCRSVVPPPMLRMIDHGIVAGDRLSRLTSLPYQIALAALAPRHGLRRGGGGGWCLSAFEERSWAR